MSRLLGSVHELACDDDVPPGEEVLDGSPTAAVAELGTVGGAEVGIWEMTPGTARDVEADELFVVVSGHATVTFDDDEVVELRAGSVVRLAAGDRTTWVVHDTLRKVYVTPRDPQHSVVQGEIP
ncbi:hypothetical protein BJ993_002796 [Nocardioides aromaticivorans]|uniref:(S)-ureidoglycine aminohydrolase cupin domain-containing protein n=1 Tax=Nocardioides aromaticivorans TaxID=200618 RepID=A0A7Y9ZLI4_9ACTN|nr:cupin domain-containing protein [Nocardioides aromaticivorans]NYI45716.1 hypothetical protein [Nocardioides aromaticivorans]